MNARPNIVALAWDGLSALFLGPYGNSWIPTPSLNELASSGLLAEWCYAESLDLSDVYRAWWTGFAPGRDSGQCGSTLARALAQLGYSTVCFSDEAEVAQLAVDSGFETVELWEQPSECLQVGDWQDTFAAQSVMAAVSRIAGLREPFFAWIHIGVLARMWQAPWEWRAAFGDEEDPDPSERVEPPKAQLGADPDPDVLLDYAHCYGAEVMLADACLGLLRDGPAQAGLAHATRWIITSPRGYELGDHGLVGLESVEPYSVGIQVPFIVGELPQEKKLLRRRGIYGQSDLYATALSLSDTSVSHPWSRSLVDGEAEPDRGVTLSQHARHLRVPAWSCLWRADDRFELYVQPDDRWQVNEVSARRPEIQELGAAELERWLAAATEGRREALGPLPPELQDVGE